jgi:hypothetical protein
MEGFLEMDSGMRVVRKKSEPADEKQGIEQGVAGWKVLVLLSTVSYRMA